MSNGESLLRLQEIDIEIGRLKGELAALPELKSLAKKRRALASAREELLKVTAQRKDVETDLEDLAAEEADYRARVDEAQARSGGSSDYRQVQDLEIELTNLAKWLDKVAFDQKDRSAKLAELTAREEQGRSFIEKLEASILKGGEAARSAATDIQASIEEDERRRETVYAKLPDDLKRDYEEASKRFKGLGVERLKGSVPSLCRMTLTEASLDAVRRTEGVTTCPYCHRILVVETGEE